MSKAALSRLAEEVREEIQLSPGDPFDFDRWSVEYGVPLVSLDELQVSFEAREHVTRTRPEVWSAALVSAGAQPLIVYNSAHSAERIRSDLGHETAHLVLEHEMRASWISEPGRCAGSSRDQEKEAAELAGFLLIPLARAQAHTVRGGSPLALAARYNVSVEMARWRMDLSGGRQIAQRAARRRR